MNPRLLDILCCPATQAPLRFLTAEELASVARAVTNGEVTTVGGRRLSVAPQAGLITVNGRTIYPVEDDIPVMLVDESIAADQISGLAHHAAG